MNCGNEMKSEHNLCNCDDHFFISFHFRSSYMIDFIYH